MNRGENQAYFIGASTLIFATTLLIGGLAVGGIKAIQSQNQQGRGIVNTESATFDRARNTADSRLFLLHQKAQLQHEKEIDKQHQIYTLMMVGLLSLGLFSVSFATVRTLSKYLKISEVISYVG